MVTKRNFDYSGANFTAADYAVLGLMLAISMIIGIYYAYMARKQKSFKEYFTASGNMGVLPTAFSLIASVLCSIWYIGVPAEVYNYGFHFIADLPMVVVSLSLVAVGYLPVYYEMKLTSANEYLEKRFNRSIRLCGSGLYLLNSILYVALVMFIPALSISQVTGIHLWSSIMSMCVIGTIYTALGGIRAVMWTDVFQMLVIYSSMIAVVIMGTINVGGVATVFERSVAGKRAVLPPFIMEPRVRYNFGSIYTAAFVYWLGLYGTTQTQVQRYVSCPTLARARRALWWNVPAFWIIESIVLYIGLVLYANYYDCDPVTTGEIATADELLTYFVTKTFGTIPGLPGLFVAGVFSGALSTISSCLNSMAAVTMEDFVAAIPRFKNMREATATALSRWIALFYGFFSLIIMIFVEKVDSVIGFYVYNNGAVGGVILGLFTLGLFCPWANSKGATIGALASIGLGLLIGVGGQAYGTTFPTEAMSIDGCNKTFLNMTMLENVTIVNLATDVLHTPNEGFYEIFKISPYNMQSFPFLAVMIVGTIASWFTRNKTDEPVDPKYISPIIRRFLRRSPKEFQKIPSDIDDKNHILVYQNEDFADKLMNIEKEVNEYFLKNDESNDQVEQEMLINVSNRLQKRPFSNIRRESADPIPHQEHVV